MQLYSEVPSRQEHPWQLGTSFILIKIYKQAITSAYSGTLETPPKRVVERPALSIDKQRTLTQLTVLPAFRTVQRSSKRILH